MMIILIVLNCPIMRGIERSTLSFIRYSLSTSSVILLLFFYMAALYDRDKDEAKTYDDKSKC